MNLRSEFDAILREWGHDVLLQRRINPFEEENRETMFSNTLEKWTVRHRLPSNASLPNAQNEAAQGIMHEVDMLYYFSHEAVPREGDRIYEETEGFPDDFITWIISYSLPMKGKGGELVYWVVGVIRETPS